MSWILGAIYCGLVWLVFAKLRLIRLSLPIAILLASVGPSLIIALLLCAQYLHPFTPSVIVLERIDPITPQVSRAGRVTSVEIEPNTPISAGDVLFKIDPIPYQNRLERAEAALAQAMQGVDLAESSVAVAEAAVKRTQADLEYAVSDRDRQQRLRESGGASQAELERAITRFQQATATLSQAEESRLQAELSVAVSKSTVAEAEVAVEDARYDLEQTTVTAPADGYVTNLQLREGMLVGGGTGAVMSFVREPEQADQGVVVASFAEKNFLRIKPGQYTEVAMVGYPGEILTGRVLNTIEVSGTAQMNASGTLPTTLGSGSPTTFAVRVQLDDAEDLRLPGGARGVAAIYTEDIQIAGIPVMFLIRTYSWLNYIQ